MRATMAKVSMSNNPLHLTVDGTSIIATTWRTNVTHLYRRVYIDPSSGVTAADLAARWGNGFYARVPVGEEQAGALDIYDGDFIELAFTTPTFDLGAQYQEVDIQIHEHPIGARLAGGLYRFLGVDAPYVGDPEWRFEIASPHWTSEDIQAMRDLGIFNTPSRVAPEATDDER